MSLEVNIEKKLDGFTLRAAFSAGNTPTALLGASGCGKSMTLRCIAGIVKPDKGRIVLDGRVLFDSEQHIDLPPQQRGAGLLFQNYALFPNMTVEQNILCGLKAAGALRRTAAGHAAGAAGKAVPGPAFRRAAAAHRAGPHPCWAAAHPDAGRALQRAGQLPARGCGKRSGQSAGRV